MAITNAIIKAGENALGRAVAQQTPNALGQALAGGVARGLTGAGISTLSKGAGSTLDGILGPSSGIVLPQPQVKTVTLPQATEQALGTPLTSVGQVMDNLGVTLADVKADNGLSKKNLATVEKNAREIADINQLPLDAIDISSKTNLPPLNREQYYDDTIGRVGKNGVRAADVPKAMQSHLITPDAAEAQVMGSNDEILRDLFKDQTSDISTLYDRYNQLAEGRNANEIFTPENIDMGIAMEGAKGDQITQDFSDRVFGNKKTIPVSSASSGAKNVKVSRAKADTAAEEAAKVSLANKLNAIKEEINAATGGAGMGAGGGTPAATTSPDYGGLGASGFETTLNTGEPVTVRAAAGASGASKQQIGIRNVRDKAIKGINATPRQYRDLMGKSRSIGDFYDSVADRIDAENLSPSNVGVKTEAMLSHIENIKAEAFRLADEMGLTVDLGGIDNTIGLKPYQKKQLTDLGFNLNEMIGDKVLSPTQAEEVYKILRDAAYDLMDDNSTALEKSSGKNLAKAAEEVSDRINKTLDNMGVDYKASFLEGTGVDGAGIDPRYTRAIAENGKPMKFSDLRREESDWINIGKTKNNPLKESKVPGSFAEAIGQGAKAGSEKIKEKVYRKWAGGNAGGAGAGNGGAGRNTGGAESTGAGANINFENIPTEKGTLGKMLDRAKTAGLVGGSILGGMALSGGRGGGEKGSNDLASIDTGVQTESEPEEDPYETMTIGGYTYDQLERGYSLALMDGNTTAAKTIASMIDMLENKIERYNKAKESSKSDIASKQKAALNVLSGLISNYEAQGPIQGNITGFLNSITGGGYNPQAYAYTTGAEGSLGTVIKALGDTGALSEGDQERARKLMPQVTDSPAAAKEKYQQLINIIKGAGAQ